MKIGIDAKYYFDGPPSGVMVVRNLVDSLVMNYPGTRFYLFIDKNFKEKSMMIPSLNKKNVELIFVHTRVNFITNLFILPILISKYRLDLVMFQNIVPLYRITGVKYINYFHDILFKDKPEYFTWLERRLYSLFTQSLYRSDGVITISRTEKERIVRCTGLNSQIIEYVHHGLDTFSLSNVGKDEAGIVEGLEDKFILYVGRINVRKNLSLLLKAISMFNVPDRPHLIIVGSKDSSYDLESEISAFGIKENVTLLGHLHIEHLRYVYSRAKLFVFPSLAEGFGLPPLEAMKSGVPALVSDLEVFREIMGDKAVYFDPRNPQDLHEKMKKLLNDSDWLDLIREEGIEHASLFTWRRSASKIMKAFSRF